MGIVGAEVRMPLGEPWRVGKRPYGHSALSTAAACLKGFYLHQSSLGVNGELGKKLDTSRLPSRADRRRAFLGHVKSTLPTNPLAPSGPRRRHPKMLPDGARETLLATVHSARDRLVVTWLADGGLRIGELCGLHLADLHLRENAACGQCRTPHLHVCHRPDNPNRAGAKTKHPWGVEDGTVTGGLIKRVSPAMVHTYFEYLTGGEYPRATARHGMLLVQLHGPGTGQPWAPVGARRMLGRAGKRAGLGLVKPHAFRHNFTSAVLDASDGNLLIARDAGGWASAAISASSGDCWPKELPTTPPPTTSTATSSPPPVRSTAWRRPWLASACSTTPWPWTCANHRTTSTASGPRPSAPPTSPTQATTSGIRTTPPPTNRTTRDHHHP
ncbi:tyrosine-type recombinase/integrase [Kitasatospora sp. GP82]|uniref:tyrosine-type recombinase/integrase n=1 Tax=Kitasatospora sp. GP82 TaxID=3035089 RepID=UPI002476B179|nr:tyrosine-type recombinase/integrase [Kitasatospora sp. GP82]MDH6130198.1 integrase [Kitasatospora sp. GP82]